MYFKVVLFYTFSASSSYKLPNFKVIALCVCILSDYHTVPFFIIDHWEYTFISLSEKKFIRK